jgi:probable DNA metabolism protein
LSAVFEVFRLKLAADQVEIVPEDRYQDQLFGDPLRINTSTAHAERVEKGLEKAGKQVAKLVYRVFHSEYEKREAILVHLLRRVFAEGAGVLDDLTDDHVLRCSKLNNQMGREIHRMHAFVRFQQTPDDLYVALINPDFNVLPLLEEHFVARYPGQDWLIYDTIRHYGLHYDEASEATSFITFAEGQHGRLRQLSESLLAERETDYQQLWKSYFDAVDIPERRNLKLHLQHVPRRYWKYLVEK